MAFPSVRNLVDLEEALALFIAFMEVAPRHSEDLAGPHGAEGADEEDGLVLCVPQSVDDANQLLYGEDRLFRFTSSCRHLRPACRVAIDKLLLDGLFENLDHLPTYVADRRLTVVRNQGVQSGLNHHLVDVSEDELPELRQQEIIHDVSEALAVGFAPMRLQRQEPLVVELLEGHLLLVRRRRFGYLRRVLSHDLRPQSIGVSFGQGTDQTQADLLLCEPAIRVVNAEADDIFPLRSVSLNKQGAFLELRSCHAFPSD